MAVRIGSAAAVLAAAVAVYALVRERRLRRRLVLERASGRLMAGCLAHDLEVFRSRVTPLLAQQAVVTAAGRVLDDALSAHDPQVPPMEGGPR
ncbi:hypothetical protein [Streptomyces griseosporeus]|uniref:hypothetical protein n=1 Tax=Streptomyces griseosporeus TaxID=1910 RepID=UPI0037036CDD